VIAADLKRQRRCRKQIMPKTLSNRIVDAQARYHKLLPAAQFLRLKHWHEDELQLRVLAAIVKVWDEGGGVIDSDVLSSRFGVSISDRDLSQVVELLAQDGVLEQLNDEEDTFAVSAKGLNLARELASRRAKALQSDE
jgi:hypothetical protein